LAGIFLLGLVVDRASSFRPGFGVFASVVLYFANWLTIARGTQHLGAFGHLWSLSVEEQFYLVWPLGRGGRCRPERPARSPPARLHRRGDRRVRGAHRDPRWSRPSLEHLRTGTDTNADDTLLGCALAVVLYGASPARRARITALLGRAVVPAILYLVHVLVVDQHVLAGRAHAAWWFPIMQTAFAASSAVVIGHNFLNQRSAVARFLSIRPLVRLGEISYGWYLWHVPVFGALRLYLDPYNRVTGLVLGVAITYAISSTSYRFVELPIRQRARPRVVVAGQ